MFPPSQHDPFRPQNWRWERARHLREHGKYSRQSRDDAEVVQAKQYQFAKSKCLDDADRYTLSLQYPGIFYADRIYNEERKAIRWTIEARLLSRDDLEEVASLSNTSLEVVHWYEKLFFNVLPVIDNRDYIINIVMGESVHNGLRERDYDLLWKMYSYNHGPFMADWFISGFQNPKRASGPDECRSLLRNDYQITVERRAAVTARTMPINNFNATAFMDGWNKLLEIEKTLGTSGEGRDLIMTNVKAMLESMPLTVIREYRGVDAEKLRYYDEAGAELRANEMIALSLGIETPAIRAIPLLTFPEAAKDGQANQ
jgi:hypothetical protein